jgi:TonB family protein
MAGRQTGIFFVQHNVASVSASFPRELRSKLFSHLEPRFTSLFLGLLVVLGGTVLIISLRKLPDTVSENQILKIQERYASIVLNQPKPKPKEVEKAKEVKTASTAKEEAAPEKKEEVKVDREKESYTAKQARKAETRVEREAVRQKVAQQVQSSGIFAAITAVGTGAAGANSAGASVNDLLGAASESVGNLSNLKISKGTFATKNVDAADIKARRGQVTSGVDIARESVGKTSASRISSGGSVNITSAPPEITGEAASLASRTQASIQRVTDLEGKRLKHVFENWLKRDPALHGQLRIKFTILPTGEVANVSIVSSTMNNSEFDENIVRYIKRWTFPPVEGGGPVEVTFPFVFEGQPS